MQPGSATVSDDYTIALSTMTINTRNHNGIAVVEVIGELDLVSGGSLLAVLTSQLDQRPTGLVVDLTRTVFFGSTGIAALLETTSRAQDRGVVVVVVTDHRAVLRPLQVTGADQHLGIQPAVDLTLAALEAEAAPSLP
jgi:anti-sigma B factor antagonist